MLKLVSSTGKTHNWNLIFFSILFQLTNLFQFKTRESVIIQVEEGLRVLNWNDIVNRNDIEEYH